MLLFILLKLKRGGGGGDYNKFTLNGQSSYKLLRTPVYTIPDDLIASSITHPFELTELFEGLSHSLSTGGGTGVVTVPAVTSLMILSASLVAWYIRKVSSRFKPSSGDSSIKALCKVHNVIALASAVSWVKSQIIWEIRCVAQLLALL